MDDIELSLKANWPDTPDDYGVFWTSDKFGKWRIGRIMHLPELPGSDTWRWMVNLPLPIPPLCHGRVASLVEAQSEFRRAWETFLPTLTASQLQQAFDVHQGAGRRVL